MPTAVDAVTKDMAEGKVRQLVQSSIQKLIEEGKSPEEAAGQAYGTAEQRWGRSLPKIR